MLDAGREKEVIYEWVESVMIRGKRGDSEQ